MLDNEIILTLAECDLQNDGQFLKVINAYLKPKCHLPDSDSVRKYV